MMRKIVIFAVLTSVLWPWVAQANEGAYVIELEIPKIEARVYEKPYTAIWVASKSNKPVRLISLLGDEEQWQKDLKNYWRRIVRHNVFPQSQVDGLTGATRGAGKHVFKWDGKDSSGDLVADGDYKLCAEVAREHGERSAKCIFISLPLLKPAATDAAETEFTKLKIYKAI